MSTPDQEPAVIPGKRRSLPGVLRDMIGRRGRDRAELSSAAAYWRWLNVPADGSRQAAREEPRTDTIRPEDLPAFRPEPSRALSSAEQPPWAPAPSPAGSPDPAPVPEGNAPQDPPALRYWSPGDAGDPPTVVMNAVRPAIEGDLEAYLRGLPRYPGESAPPRP